VVSISKSDRYFLKSFLYRKFPYDTGYLDLYNCFDYYETCCYKLLECDGIFHPITLLSREEINIISNYINKYNDKDYGQEMLIYYDMLKVIIRILIKYQDLKVRKTFWNFEKKLDSNEQFIKGFLLLNIPEYCSELGLCDCFIYYQNLCSEILENGKLDSPLKILTINQKKKINSCIDEYKNDEFGKELLEYYLVLKTVIEILKTYCKEDCM